MSSRLPSSCPLRRRRCGCLRVFRLLRAFAVVGVIVERLGRPLSRQAGLAILAVLALAVLAGGVSIVGAEPAKFPTVAQGYAWAVATLVTAGHTTPEPTTAVGRAVSTTIVVLGLGTFAALAASISTRR